MKRAFLILAACCEALVALVLIANIAVRLETRAYIFDMPTEAPKAEAILIPGAAVLPDKTLSPVLQDRANRAIELYRLGKAPKILVSGDNSTLTYNEVNPVRNYLLSRGIPDQDIFLDHAGFDTYSTMYRAREIFGVTSVLVASQSFHLPRAVFIARELGIDASGVSADDGHYLLSNYLRDTAAVGKALFDLAVRRKPEYLGATIPISGDGRLYP